MRKQYDFSKGVRGKYADKAEFLKMPRFEVEPIATHPHTFKAKEFLHQIRTMGPTDALFFEAVPGAECKRLATKLHVRLWRYAEAGYIRFREFNVISVDGGMSVLRNLDPLETGRKRNLNKNKGQVRQ